MSRRIRDVGSQTEESADKIEDVAEPLNEVVDQETDWLQEIKD